MALRRTFGDWLFEIFLFVVLGLLAFVCVYPFVWVASASLSSPEAVMSGKVYLLPVGFTFDTYTYVLSYRELWQAYGNTIFYVVVGTIVNVALTMLTAYPLSRSWFKARGPVTGFIVFTMFFGGGMIPLFLVVRSLGLLNSRAAMILPSAIGVWEVIMARAFLTANIPDELVEAAEIDGANDLQIFLSIVIPLSKPIIAVITLFYAVFHWNDFFNALIFLTNQDLYPLQVVLRKIVTSGAQAQLTAGTTMTKRALLTYTLRYAAIMAGTVPIMAVYPFLQKYFVKGALLGSLKG